MSRSTFASVQRLAALAAVNLTFPLAIAAQEVTDLTDEQLIRRIEALVPEYEEALAARDARLAAVRTDERRPTPADTVQVGPMRIVTPPDDVDATRTLFEEVWRESFDGLEVSPSLSRHLFVFQWRTRVRSMNVEAAPDRQVINLELERIRTPTVEHAKNEIRDALSRAFTTDFPRMSPMAAWLTAQGHPSAEEMYRLLATQNIGASRACLQGSAIACGATLGFGFGNPAADLAHWFSPQDQRAMVGELARRRDRGIDGDDPLVRSCTGLNDAGACATLLARLQWVSHLPVSDRLRAHALWFAVRLGGEGAWQRALERADAPPSEVLAHVSGLPIDEFLAAWRDEMIANRPDARAGLGGKGTRVLMWSLIFAALAMRSTRWRLA